MSLATTAPTRSLRVGDDDIAYREVGSGPPLVLLQRFRGTVDHWDPAFVDRLAVSRRVIAFDAPGVGGSTGTPKASIAAMADDAAAVVRALDLGQPDILGWSMGGMVAQGLAVYHPELVRRTVLVATCPPANPRLVAPPPEWVQVVMKPVNTLEDVIAVFYTDSPSSRAAAEASEARMAAGDTSGTRSTRAMRAMGLATRAYFTEDDGLFERLGEIRGPVLIGGGDHDRAFPAIDQVLLLEAIPHATLAMYPDSGHGFHMQHTAEFCAAVTHFLDAEQAP